MDVVAVAAVADNLVIGEGSTLPWPKLDGDREQYRARVADSPVILGRKTFEYFGTDHPGTHQIVLSRTERSFDAETVVHAGSVDKALELAASFDANTVYVLGGAAIYRLFMPVLTGMVLTRVPGEYDGDAYFPDWDDPEWTLVDTVDFDGFVVEEWRRDHHGTSKVP